MQLFHSFSTKAAAFEVLAEKQVTNEGCCLRGFLRKLTSGWTVHLQQRGIIAFSEIRPSDRRERAIPSSMMGGVGFLLKTNYQ